MANQYLTIKEAAELLEVTPLTLRNWDKNGKLKALRHPINNYRVYKKEDIESLIEDLKTNYSPKKNTKREFKKVMVRHLSDNE